MALTAATAATAVGEAGRTVSRHGTGFAEHHEHYELKQIAVDSFAPQVMQCPERGILKPVVRVSCRVWAVWLCLLSLLCLRSAQAGFTVPLTNDQGGWSLVGLPASGVTMPGGVEAYTYKGLATPVTSGSAVLPGQGLWVLPGPGVSQLTVGGNLTQTAQVIEVQLARGWNLIANPYPQAVAWGDNVNVQGPDSNILPLSAASAWVLPTAFGVTAGQVNQVLPGTAGAKLNPFKGYWFFARENTKLIFSFATPTAGPAQDSPVITALNPAAAHVGEVVSVAATGFDPADAVLTLGGVPLAVQQATLSNVVFIVPAGASSGEVKLTSGGQTSEGAAFVVLTSGEDPGCCVASAGPPVISQIAPLSGNPGTILVIDGAEFSATLSENQVLLGGLPATVLSASLTQLTVRTPATVAAGAQTLTVSVNAQNSAPVAYTVTSVLPVVNNLSPTSGSVNTAITIDGSNFDTDPNNLFVNIGGLPVTVLSASLTQIAAVVPPGVVTGALTVALGALTASATPTFTVLPTLDAISPSGTLVWDQTVTLTGTGFSATPTQNAVFFSTSSASVTAATPTSLTVTVPFGVEDDVISLAVAGVSASATLSYSIGPSITSVSPSKPVGGQNFFIYGKRFGSNLGDISNIYLGQIQLFKVSLSQSAGVDILEVMVPNGINSGYLSFMVNGVSTNQFLVSVKPTITSIFPRLARAGDTITIRGVGFSNFVTDNAIHWGTALTVQLNPLSGDAVLNQTEITTRVPSDATSSLVKVSVGGTGNQSDGLFVQVQPIITSSSITVGVVGEPLMLYGTGFGALSSDAEVFFNSNEVAFSASTSTTLSLSIPLGAYTGYIQIRNGGSLGAFSPPYTFSVTPFVATITPAQGPAESPLTILGSGFEPGDTQVCFANAGATGAQCFAGQALIGTITAMTSLQISTLAPAGFSRGQIYVRTGGTGGLISQENAGTFTAGPVVTSVTGNYTDSVTLLPSRPVVQAGTTVTVTGNGFAPTAADNTVWFNKTPVAPTSATTSTLTVTAPPGMDANLNGTIRNIQVSTFDSVFGLSGVTQVGNNVSPTSSSNTFWPVVGIGRMESSTGTMNPGVTAGIYASGLNTAVPGQMSFTVNGISYFQAGIGYDTSPAANAINISFSVPSSFDAGRELGAHSGPYTFSLYVPTPAGYYPEFVSVTGSFSIKPTITGFSVNPATVGQQVTLNGQGFSNDFNNMGVMVDGQAAGLSSSTFTSLVFRVPTGASTGDVTVTTNYQGASGTSDPLKLTITPVISSINPSVAGLGQTIVVVGEGFGKTPADNQVSLGGVLLNIASATATALGVDIPSSMVSGPGSYPLVVSTSNISSGAFLVSVAPVISSITPASANIGDAIVISGLGFDGNPASNTITFSGTVNTTATAVSGSTDLTVSVPANAVAGPVSVTVNGQTSLTVSYNITPKLTSLTISEGNVGATMQVYGTGFSPIASENIVRFGLTNATVISSSNTHLGLNVPAVPATGPLSISVLTKNVISSNEIPFTILPRITNLSPPSGGAGITLTINGKGFSTTPASNIIKFNNTTVATQTASTTQLTCIVPYNVETSPVTVTVGGLVTNAVMFQMMVTLSTSQPSTAGGGEIIQVIGNGFDGATGNNSITFGGVPGTVLSADFSTLTAEVPMGLTAGATTLVVTTNGNASNSIPFTVRPVINSVAPGAARVGDNVAITGSSFDPVPGNNVVRFLDPLTGPLATVNSGSVTTLNVQVPVGADNGPIYVITSGLQSNPSYFQAIPAISSLSLLSVSTSAFLIGERMEINGSGFSTTMTDNTTKIGTLPVTLSSSTQTKIEVVIPTGATSGNVTVTRNGYTSNGWPMVVKPTILSIAPPNAQVGAQIVITGGAFSTTPASNTVTFPGAGNVTPTAATQNSLTLNVPTGALSGSISVTVGSITGNAVNFTVDP